MKKTFVDLFAGCGGLSLGLQNAGWQLQFAIEAHTDAFKTYKSNLIDRRGSNVDWPRWLPCTAHDIVDVIANHREQLEKLSGKIDLVVGGPPCQGFSTNGRRKHDDPRNQLVKNYLKIVSILSPRVLLLENVRGFTSMQIDAEKTFSEFVCSSLKRQGYDVWSKLIVASDWGVPQRRPRFFLIATKKGLLNGVDPFERLLVLRRSFLEKRKLPPNRPVSAKEAIEDLRTLGRSLSPDPEFGELDFKCLNYREPSRLSEYARCMRGGTTGRPGDMRLPKHTDLVTSRFAKILATCPKGRSIAPADRKRLGIRKRSTTPIAPDMPSPTVTTLPDDMIHYAEPRILTVREHARLQSFPDWFKFEGPYTSGGLRRQMACPRYTQVGNAVPPLLSEAFGEMLAGLFKPLHLKKRTNAADITEVHSHVLA